MPSDWNRSKATALAVALLLHGALAYWLLGLRIELPEAFVESPAIEWLLPAPEPERPPPPPPMDLAPSKVPVPEFELPAPASEAPIVTQPDWPGEARREARAIGQAAAAAGRHHRQNAGR